VHAETDKIVDPVVWRESAVSRFMGHAPPAGQDHALPMPVQRPQGPFDRRSDIGRHPKVIHERTCKGINEPSELVNGDGAENITSYVKESLPSVLLMQMFGNN